LYELRAASLAVEMETFNDILLVEARAAAATLRWHAGEQGELQRLTCVRARASLRPRSTWRRLATCPARR
jgi:hypothetical protein